jgi:hypothetical protein
MFINAHIKSRRHREQALKFAERGHG